MQIETINAILVEAADVSREPAPGELHPMEAAEVMGIVDEVFDDIYPHADEQSGDYPF